MRLSDTRAFLVRLSDETTTTLQPFMGRVEHVETGLSRTFKTPEELQDFVAAVLAAEETYDDESPDQVQSSG